MIYLKQSTASQEIILGYFVDSTDGDTEEPSLTIANTDIKIWKNGATTLENKNSGGATHISNGIYYATLDATDTNTLGPMKIYVHVSGARPVVLECCVLSANIFDSWIAGTDNQNVTVDTTSDASIADAVWDEVLTGVSHNIVSSAGRRLRTIQEFQGYEGGKIWVDTINGTAGTTAYENGTVENPVNSWANALTIASSVGLSAFHIINGSSITLTADSTNYTIEGDNWTLALNGQTITGMHVKGASVTGTGLGTGYDFHDCELANGETLTISNGDFFRCAIAGSIVLTGAATYYFDQCFSGVAGTSTPDIDFGAAVANTNVNFRHYSGGIEVKNIGQSGTDNMSLEGYGQLKINANCAGGTIAIRGNFTVTDNADGVVTLSDNARYDVDQVADSVWDEVLTASSHNTATTAGRRLRDISTSVIITGTSPNTGGSTNTLTSIELDSDASSTDGAYDPAVINIIAGTGAGQSRQIFEYNGTNKIAYINRDWKVIPDNTSEYTITANSGDTHVNEGVCQAATSNTFTLNALASSVNDTYKGQYIFIVAGTGADQVNKVQSYVGSTKVATMENTWATTPDSTSVYAMLPLDCCTVAENAAKVWESATRTLTAGTNLNDLSAAEVNAEVLDVLNVDTFAQPGQESPAATTTLVKMLGYLYKALRNKKTQTSTTFTLYADDGTTADQIKTVSDDGTTFTEGEMESGS